MEISTFAPGTYTTTPLGFRTDGDGKVWMSITAHATLTALTAYKVILGHNGYETAALADDTFSYWVGAPAKAIASGATGWIQIGGLVINLITPSLSMAVGDALEIHDGAIADQGAHPTGALNEFAVAVVATTTSTTQTVILYPHRITATT